MLFFLPSLSPSLSFSLSLSFSVTSELIFTEVPPPGHPGELQSFAKSFLPFLFFLSSFFFFFLLFINIRVGGVGMVEAYGFLVSDRNGTRLLLRLFSSGNVIPEKPLIPFASPGGRTPVPRNTSVTRSHGDALRAPRNHICRRQCRCLGCVLPDPN